MRCVLAVVVLAVVLGGCGAEPVARSGPTSTATPTRQSDTSAASGDPAQLGPVGIEDFVDGGFDYRGTVDRRRNANRTVTDTLCLVGGPSPAQSAEDVRRDGRCRTSTVVDDGPARIHPMATAPCDTDRDPAGSQCPMVVGVVIVTEPSVARVEIDAVGHRSTTTTHEVGRTDGVVLFQTALRRSAVQDRFTYIAHDADGKVIDEVTLHGVG